MKKYNIILSIVICMLFLIGILVWNNLAVAKETDFEKAIRIGLAEQRWSELVKKKGGDFSKWRFGLFERHGIVLEALAGWRMGNGHFAMEKGDISSQDEFNRLWSSLTNASEKSTEATVKGIGIIGEWINAIRGTSTADLSRAERTLRESGHVPSRSPITEKEKWVLVKPPGFSKYISVRFVQQEEDWDRVVNETKERIQNLHPGKEPRVLIYGHGALGGSAQSDMYFASALAASADFDIVILPSYTFRARAHLYDTAHAAKWTMEGIAKFNKAGIIPSFGGFSASAEVVVKMGQLLEKGKIWARNQDIAVTDDIRNNFYLNNVVTFAYPFSNAPFGKVRIPHKLRGRIKGEITNFVSEKGGWSNYIDGATNIQLTGPFKTPHAEWNNLENFKDFKRVEILALALQGKTENELKGKMKKSEDELVKEDKKKKEKEKKRHRRKDKDDDDDDDDDGNGGDGGNGPPPPPPPPPPPAAAGDDDDSNGGNGGNGPNGPDNYGWLAVPTPEYEAKVRAKIEEEERKRKEEEREKKKDVYTYHAKRPQQKGPEPEPYPGQRPKPGASDPLPWPTFPQPEEGPVWGPAPGGGVSAPDTKPPLFPYPPDKRPPYEWPLSFRTQLGWQPPMTYGGLRGGIYLNMPADIVGLNTAEINGAIWDDREKQLSLIVKGDVVSFPKTYLDDFVSILMTVYGGEDPGISIDPGGYTDQCSVRYIGKVKNTRFGRTLFEADRLLKSLSLGKDTLTGYPINPGIPGFKTMVELFEEYGMKYSGALYRFWFVPSEMRIRQSGDAFIFDKARLEVKTEYMFKKGKKSETEPAAKAFAEFLTMHYDEFAYRYPLLKDLIEYAKMVSIAQWLKEHNVPLNWFLLANSWSENIPTPDVTPAMFSEHPRYPFEVWGGVDFRMTNEYLPTTGPMPVVSEAALAKYSTQFTDVPVWNIGDTSWNVAGVSPGKKFEVKDEVYTAIGMPSTTMVSNGRKLVFHTDAVMHSSPRIELIRYYIGDNPRPSEFGYGWSLLVPYKLEPTDDKRITYQDVSLPERMTVIDLINNKKETLKFETKKYVNVGYFPEEQGQFKGLLLMSDASFQLIDRWDNSFHFDQQGGRLMVADMGKENKWFYVYRGEKIIGIINEEGSEIGFEYDPNGRIEKAIIANKGTIKGEVSYVYDTKGDLVKVIGLDGKVTEYQYNNSHMLLSLIPRDAGWEVWQYVAISVLSFIFGVGILWAYKNRKRKNP